MTTKTIYFGAYTQDEIDEMGLTDAFEFEGKFYEFKMEIYLEDGFLRLYDSCDRMIPLDMVHYGQATKALELASGLQRLETLREQLEEAIYDTKSAIGLGGDSEVDECCGRC